MNTIIQEGVVVLENLTLDVISKVIDHNAKGHDLLTSPTTTNHEITNHHCILMGIISIIRPIIDFARRFISANHPILLGIFNWIEKICNIIVPRAAVAA